MIRNVPVFLLLATLLACQSNEKKPMTDSPKVHLITLDPGHFHAGLVQKFMYDQVDPVVHVYALGGPELDDHLARINSYNTRTEQPTHWEEVVYTGPDFLEKMIADKAGNVVVISGNNAKKAQYIDQSIVAGFNVLADKPMAIRPEDYPVLQHAFSTAAKNGRLLYDIMTERYEITTQLQKALSHQTNLFGTLETGSMDNPAITKESVHHYFKYVSGVPLIRPAWFFDVEQQGEGIVDVSTHLVDLILWECFPEQIIDTNEVTVEKGTRWATELTPAQFNRVTGLNEYPEYLHKDLVRDSILAVYANGAINFSVKDVQAKVSVTWNYEAPEGAKDTHYSIMRGTKANLVIRQGAAQQYHPTLYVEPVDGENAAALENPLAQSIQDLQSTYPGIGYQPSHLGDGWEIIIPDSYDVGHEAHFGQVTEHFLEYLAKGKLPDWEVPNMLTKYWVTTKGYAMSR